MNKLIRTFEKSDLLSWESLRIEFFKGFFLIKYGSPENVQKEISKIRLKCTSDQECIMIINQMVEDFFPPEVVLSILTVLSQLMSFTNLVNADEVVEEYANNHNLDVEKVILFIKIYESIRPSINEKLGKNERDIKDKLLNEFNDKITFTIKETREELGFRNQQTFKKWLNYFFKDKYDNKRNFKLIEYIEVIEKFFLNPDESSLDLKNKKTEYKKRLDAGLVFKKGHLKKFTKNEYKLLKAELDDFKQSNIVSIPEDVDFVPYSIAQLIKKQLV